MRKTAVLLLLTLCLALLAACGGGSAPAQDASEEADDFLLGTWFARSAEKDGETLDPDEVFGGTFYLYFDEDNCMMCIDDQRAVVSWERTGDGVTLSGDGTYAVTFPDHSQTTLVVNINGVDVRMEKYVEE